MINEGLYFEWGLVLGALMTALGFWIVAMRRNGKQIRDLMRDIEERTPEEAFAAAYQPRVRVRIRREHDQADWSEPVLEWRIDAIADHVRGWTWPEYADLHIRPGDTLVLERVDGPINVTAIAIVRGMVGP